MLVDDHFQILIICWEYLHWVEYHAFLLNTPSVMLSCLNLENTHCEIVKWVGVVNHEAAYFRLAWACNAWTNHGWSCFKKKINSSNSDTTVLLQNTDPVCGHFVSRLLSLPAREQTSLDFILQSIHIDLFVHVEQTKYKYLVWQHVVHKMFIIVSNCCYS